MKFLHRPVTALEDATANFEQLEARSILDLTPTNLLQLAVAAKRKIGFGTGSFTGNATPTVQVTQAHGLGVTPVIWMAFPIFQGTVDQWGASTSTNFFPQFHIVSVPNVAGNSVTAFSSAASTWFFNWLAIG